MDFYTNYRSSNSREERALLVLKYRVMTIVIMNIVFSSATQDPFKKDHLRSISVGILVNATMKKEVQFIDSGISRKEIVGVTCETCAVKKEVRATPPIHLEKKQ
jgi:hypothetical protein